MLDPITSLAFSMQSAKGVYALLLGSGVSRSAKIPTGWEITLELVRKIAVTQGAGELPGDSAEGWYRDTFGHAPDYAELLDGLVKTPSERQQVLKNYIEPNAAERERGDKLPTPAHRAIARLVSAGYVRVIVTTNFDQLLEDALKEHGVSPTVVTSAHAAAGAVPLVHAGCTVIKVRGDYLDTRIRNTPAELAAYEPVVDMLLDRVFDEFGLIVCGWSADWDQALRDAIERAPSRRYSMYWAARGSPSAAAAELIARRAGVALPIAGADTFFDELAQKVNALEAFNTPHPLSAELAVANLKEYLADPRDRIRLDDLIGRELERVIDALGAPEFSPLQIISDNPVNELVPRYEAACSTLVSMALVAGRWSTGEQAETWIDIIRTLGRREREAGGFAIPRDLMLLPASLVLHAYGLGAVAGKRYQEFGRLNTAIVDSSTGPMAAGDRLNASCLFRDGQARARKLGGYGDRTHALSDHLADVLRPIAKRVFRDEVAFDQAFIAIELVLALGYAERVAGERLGDQFWAPTGRYCHDARLRKEILDPWLAELRDPRLGIDSSVTIMAGLERPPRLEEVDALASRAMLGFD